LVIPFGQHLAKVNAKTPDLTLPVRPIEMNMESYLVADNGVATDALAALT
jgi:hypothetical protein